MKVVVNLHDEVYNNIVVKNEYTRMDVIAIHNALMGAVRIPEGIGDWVERLMSLRGGKEDAISRQAVLSYIYNGLGLGDEENGADIERKIELERFYEYIKSLPPVTPQQKIGHWIFVDKVKEHAHCSECGYRNVDLMDGRPHDYCPNCGVKMVVLWESEK